MPSDRPSLLRTTAPWFVGALLASATLFLVGIGGNPLGHVMITLLPWLFWVGPAIGARRSLAVLDEFAEEVGGTPEVLNPILGYPTLRWPEHGLEVEVRYRGMRVMGVFVHVDDEGTAKVGADRVREAARAALEGRIEYPEAP